MRKTLVSWPSWTDPEPPTPAHKLSSRTAFQSIHAEKTEALLLLGDEQGVGLEGVQLRLTAWAYRRMYDVSATLEVVGGRSFVNIARVDGWPPDPHTNTLARVTPGLRHVPPFVEICHVHRFSDNAKVGGKAFRPPSNLPVAVPLREPLRSFRDFLRTVGEEFVIIGIEDFDPPPSWQEYLL